jgi:menaquinol-cytochrome c reductase iron-sulfur subunit
MNSDPPARFVTATARRGFLKKSLATALGLLAALVPVAAGLVVAADPLRRKAAAGQALRVTTLAALPADGLPHRFPVIGAKTDAWTRFDATPVGAVYLRRTGGRQVEAFNVVCPHAGCSVEFEPGANRFQCPCHKSVFGLDGRVADPRSPSPRGLDGLAVSVDADGAVWVKFQNFQAGRPDKVPVA